MSDDHSDDTTNQLAALPDIYSRRKRRATNAADPLRYDDVPNKVRMQISHIFREAVTLDQVSSSRTGDEVFEFMVKFFRKELGVEKLSQAYGARGEFLQWFLCNSDINTTVDAIEVICRSIQLMADRSPHMTRKARLEGLIAEINARLIEGEIGFQFESGSIIEASSRYLHSEVVVPTLELLAGARYAAANAEYMAAHRFFREGDFEQCLVECCKAFESVIKVIAEERHWGVSPDAAAHALVKAVFDNNLIPSLFESEFTGIRTVLESGVGTLRNKSGGHGAGTKVRVVPRHFAAFQLHQTGAAITLLAEAHASSPSKRP